MNTKTPSVLAESCVVNADCLEHMATMEAESVQMIATSPPYWGLRQYLFNKAVVLRYNLTGAEREYVERELKKRGINPEVR